MLKSAAAVAPESVLIEADGKCQFGVDRPSIKLNQMSSATDFSSSKLEKYGLFLTLDIIFVV